MTRRALFGLLAATPSKPEPAPSIDLGHRWVKGPYFITAAVSYEEPNFFPPSGLVKVEHSEQLLLDFSAVSVRMAKLVVEIEERRAR